MPAALASKLRTSPGCQNRNDTNRGKKPTIVVLHRVEPERSSASPVYQSTMSCLVFFWLPNAARNARAGRARTLRSLQGP